MMHEQQENGDLEKNITIAHIPTIYAKNTLIREILPTLLRAILSNFVNKYSYIIVVALHSYIFYLI